MLHLLSLLLAFSLIASPVLGMDEDAPTLSTEAPLALAADAIKPTGMEDTEKTEEMPTAEEDAAPPARTDDRTEAAPAEDDTGEPTAKAGAKAEAEAKKQRELQHYIANVDRLLEKTLIAEIDSKKSRSNYSVLINHLAILNEMNLSLAQPKDSGKIWDNIGAIRKIMKFLKTHEGDQKEITAEQLRNYFNSFNVTFLAWQQSDRNLLQETLQNYVLHSLRSCAERRTAEGATQTSLYYFIRYAAVEEKSAAIKGRLYWLIENERNLKEQLHKKERIGTVLDNTVAALTPLLMRPVTLKNRAAAAESAGRIVVQEKEYLIDEQIRALISEYYEKQGGDVGLPFVATMRHLMQSAYETGSYAVALKLALVSNKHVHDNGGVERNPSISKDQAFREYEKRAKKDSNKLTKLAYTAEDLEPYLAEEEANNKVSSVVIEIVTARMQAEANESRQVRLQKLLQNVFLEQSAALPQPYNSAARQKLLICTHLMTMAQDRTITGKEYSPEAALKTCVHLLQKDRETIFVNEDPEAAVASSYSSYPRANPYAAVSQYVTSLKGNRIAEENLQTAIAENFADDTTVHTLRYVLTSIAIDLENNTAKEWTDYAKSKLSRLLMAEDTQFLDKQVTREEALAIYTQHATHENLDTNIYTFNNLYLPAAQAARKAQAEIKNLLSSTSDYPAEGKSLKHRIVDAILRIDREMRTLEENIQDLRQGIYKDEFFPRNELFSHVERFPQQITHFQINQKKTEFMESLATKHLIFTQLAYLYSQFNEDNAPTLPELMASFESAPHQSLELLKKNASIINRSPVVTSATVEKKTLDRQKEEADRQKRAASPEQPVKSRLSPPTLLDTVADPLIPGMSPAQRPASPKPSRQTSPVVPTPQPNNTGKAANKKQVSPRINVSPTIDINLTRNTPDSFDHSSVSTDTDTDNETEDILTTDADASSTAAEASLLGNGGQDSTPPLAGVSVTPVKPKDKSALPLVGFGGTVAVSAIGFLHLQRQDRKITTFLNSIVDASGQTLGQRFAQAEAQPNGMQEKEMHTIINSFNLSPNQKITVTAAVKKQKSIRTKRNGMLVPLAIGLVGSLVTGHEYFKKD
ncbi:MAG: hypothetical protein QG632_596 [Candidatus Dependentiae bacterium]|nr:hypothetical protein [Candidatus Dependentiae bacterium]